MINTRLIIEIVGVVSVVASLVFVGIQLILDRQLALTEIYANRAESIKSDFRTRLESDSFIELEARKWAKGDRPPWWNSDLEKYKDDYELTNQDIVSQILAYEIMALHYDNLYFQYNQGLLTEESWEVFRASLVVRMRDPIQRPLLLFRQRGLTDVLDSILSEIE